MQYPVGSAPGLTADISADGAAITALHVADRGGRRENVVARAGATIGRYANRIADASFELHGTAYRLSANDGRNTLHGGSRGFSAAVWHVEEYSGNHLSLSHLSEDGDQGFPGNVRCVVTFTAQADSLTIAYLAQSDADTVINFTNHAYFNLNGGEDGAREQVLQIFADAYTPVDRELIPTGEIAPVAGTRFDFRSPRTIGETPYDTNWVLRREGAGIVQAAMLGSARSGRVLEVLTTEPGLQLYTGDARGVALETQHFPDSPHHPGFPSTLLRAGDRYMSTTLYRFSAR